jgi:flagellin
MAFSIQTNVSALTAQENLRVNSDFQSRTIQRLTSGYRINSSGDDAAGLAIANKFRSDIAELTQGVRNANDGVAQLQVIDGGISNISKMLDRMKTLATQSSSASFTGNRATVNAEYSQLLTEIDRQAANMGLNNAGTYNRKLDIYLGGATGASAPSNAKVTVDLSGAVNTVDVAGLNLTGTSVAAAAVDLGTAKVGSVSADETFKVTVLDSAGASYTASLATAVGGGKTASQVVDALNTLISQDAKLSQAGVSFTLKDGDVYFGGNSAFYVTSNSVANSLIPSTALNQTNVGLYHDEQTITASTGAGSVTFKTASGEQTTINIGGADSIDTIVSNLNKGLNPLGIQVLQYGGAGVGTLSFQSTGSFSFSVTGGTGGMAGLTSATVNADLTKSPTAAAETALSRINSAVSALGGVQGRIGAGQNKLNYAIALANSQISNFSAAESQIRDADVAAEAANLTKAQVLQQATMAAMAQANSAPQAVLALLRG